MVGRTRATRGKASTQDPSEEQAAAATAVMALSEKKDIDHKELKQEDEAEGDEEDEDEEEEEEDEDEEEDEEAEEHADASVLPDEMAIDQQLGDEGEPSQENGSIVPDISSSFAPAPSSVPHPEDMLPNVVAISRDHSGTSKDSAVLGLLLPSLRSDALQLKNHLTQPCPNSPSWNQVWGIIRTAFDVIKAPFTTPGAVLLDFNRLRLIFEDPTTSETSVLSISIANLATILDILTSHEDGDDDLRLLLELMDDGFPFSVVHTTGISVDWLDNNDYIGTALDIRTQRWMLELDGLEKTDVVNVFKRIFLNSNEEDPSQDWDGDMSKLVEANWKEIGDFDMTELTNDENDEAIRAKVMARIHAVFEFANSQSDPEGQLTKFHEVTPFVQELRRFIVKIFDEVDRAYLAKTRQKLPGGEDEYDESSQHPAYSEASRNRNLYDGLSSLSRFSRLGQSEFVRSRKRRATADIQGDDMIIRKVPQKRQRRSMVTPAQQLAQIQAAAAAAAASQAGATSIVSTQMGAPSTIIAPTSPGGSTVVTTQTDASGRRKELQKRFFWGPSDTDKLCDYIDRYGCNWARISKEAAFEIPRTQQQLRDKARNLKVDMLRHDKILLPGFDNVGLHLKEQTLVRKHNKNPFRKEKDLDEEGNPINTEWQEGMDDEYEDVQTNAGMSVVSNKDPAVTSTQPLDTAAVTDPSLGAAAASMASLAATFGDSTHLTTSEAAQQLNATLQETPSQIKQRVQDRFGQLQQSSSLSYAHGLAGGESNQDMRMGGTEGMHIPVTGAGGLM